MRYFTKQFALGELGLKEEERIVAGYQEYLNALSKNGDVWRLVSTISLHDAYLDRVVVDRSTNKICLSLITGNRQAGYWLTELHYSSARITSGLEVLRQALANRPSEILYDEFSGAPEPVSHTFLFAPKSKRIEHFGEFNIAFSQLSFSQMRLNSRQLSSDEDRSHWG